MASLRPCSPPTSRARRTPAASDAGVLPRDVLFDALLRLPTKELCRLRAVCRSWRSLTIDPLFISAHAARHRSPLFLAKFWDGDDASIHVMNLSGNVVKRIANAPGHQLLCTSLDLACVATIWNSCSVLNPATGAAYVLPEAPALGNHESLSRPNTFYAFGQVPSTGEYKVLQMFNRPEFPGVDKHQQFKVFTINGGASNAKWRVLQSRDFFVEANSAVFVDRVVYFLMNGVYNPKKLHDISTGIPADYIASLDIEREEWRRDLQGPISGSLVMDNIDARKDYVSMWHQLTLAELKGSLVLTYYRRHQFILDL